MLEESISLTVSEEDRLQFKRLDVYLAQKLPNISRSLIKKIFENEDISTESPVKLELKKMPPVGTTIDIDFPPPLPTTLEPQNIPLKILYEDEWLIIIHKPAGLCVHPAPGHPDRTLVNAILYHCPQLKGIGQEKRPGIVHRLDLGTSGVMVVAKEQKTHEDLVSLFSTHDIEREYMALLWGIPRQLSGKIETLYGRHPSSRLKMSSEVKKGKKAISFYRVLESFKETNLSLCEFKLETGRTHQIRAHASQILKCPLLNDEIYADTSHQKKRLPPSIVELYADYPYPFLHAKVLGFLHPRTHQYLKFEEEPPEQFTRVLSHLR